MLERLSQATRNFLGALHTSSRSDVETRVALAGLERDAAEDAATRHEAAFAEWAAGCGAPQFLLPWLDRCIRDARVASRSNLSSPHETAYALGVEDAYVAVRQRFAPSRDATRGQAERTALQQE